MFDTTKISKMPSANLYRRALGQQQLGQLGQGSHWDGPVDKFQSGQSCQSQGSSRPEGLYRPEGIVAPCKTWKLPPVVRKLALATALALTTFTAVAPVPAFAAQPAAVAMMQTSAQAPAASQEALSKGVNEAMSQISKSDMKTIGIQCVDSDSKCQADFQNLPAKAQETYRKMPLGAKTLMAKQINSNTKFLGITIVNHRNAFIKGEAFGKNVFDFVTGKVDAQVQEGKLKPDQAHHARYFLQLCKELTANQRESLVRIITTDVKLAGQMK